MNKYTDFGLAKKAYHGELENYIGGETYDNVAVTLTDSYGNVLMSEYWTPTVAPEPEE